MTEANHLCVINRNGNHTWCVQISDRMPEQSNCPRRVTPVLKERNPRLVFVGHRLMTP